MTAHEEHVRQFLALRDGVVAAAVKAKKISAERADDYRKLWDASPQDVFRLLTAKVEDGGLMAGVNLGGEPFPEAPTSYPREWLAEGQPTGAVAFEDQQARVDAVAATPPANRGGPPASTPPSNPVTFGND